MYRKIKITLLISATLFAICSFLLYKYGRSVWVPVYIKSRGMRTVADIIQQHGAIARKRLKPVFTQAGIAYPPAQISLVALKEERVLELWAQEDNEWYFIKNYPIKGASGIAGPKLREGDGQVPEGIYQIEGLNPNSSYHLSMKLNYPNDFDLRNAKKEGRTQPGTNIFIHGNTGSVGCLAMGDKAIEDLFVLVVDVGKSNTKVVISPHDPRSRSLLEPVQESPVWLPDLYKQIEKEFNMFTNNKVTRRSS